METCFKPFRIRRKVRHPHGYQLYDVKNLNDTRFFKGHLIDEIATFFLSNYFRPYNENVLTYKNGLLQPLFEGPSLQMSLFADDRANLVFSIKEDTIGLLNSTVHISIEYWNVDYKVIMAIQGGVEYDSNFILVEGIPELLLHNLSGGNNTLRGIVCSHVMNSYIAMSQLTKLYVSPSFE